MGQLIFEHVHDLFQVTFQFGLVTIGGMSAMSNIIQKVGARELGSAVYKSMNVCHNNVWG